MEHAVRERHLKHPFSVFTWLRIFLTVVHVWVLNVQTAAELEKRKENFSKELDFVIADVVCSSFSVVESYYFRSANSFVGWEIEGP